MSFGNSFSDFIRKFQVIQYQYFLIIFKPSKSAIFEKFWSCFRFPRCSMRDAFMHLSWICKNYATSAHLAFNIRYYNEFIIMFLALILFLLAQGWKGIRTEDASFWCTVQWGAVKESKNLFFVVKLVYLWYLALCVLFYYFISYFTVTCIQCELISYFCVLPLGRFSLNGHWSRREAPDKILIHGQYERC